MKLTVTSGIESKVTLTLRKILNNTFFPYMNISGINIAIPFNIISRSGGVVELTIKPLLTGNYKYSIKQDNVIINEDFITVIPKEEIEINTNFLEKTNEIPFVPNKDYEPATKKYVDDSIPIIRGQAIYVQTDEPTDAQEHDLWYKI